MEVHHHGHVHEKKKWKEYLFQFLILFLAVTLGFLVENKREHYIEQQREKQFIRSLVNDIIADTTKINNIINRRTVRISNLDSLNLLMNSNSRANYANDLYYITATATRLFSIRFLPNDGTMQQLKNSGAFRLIRNRLIADSIAKYDVSVRNILLLGELEEKMAEDYRQAASKIFNALIFDQMMDADINVRRLEYLPALLTYDKGDLYDWNYKIFSLKSINKANRREIRLLLKQLKIF